MSILEQKSLWVFFSPFGPLVPARTLGFAKQFSVLYQACMLPYTSSYCIFFRPRSFISGSEEDWAGIERI
jgi:hypothetical protein